MRTAPNLTARLAGRRIKSASIDGTANKTPTVQIHFEDGETLEIGCEYNLDHDMVLTFGIIEVVRSPLEPL